MADEIPGCDTGDRVFEISEAELDALLEEVRERAQMVKRGTPTHADQQYANGLHDGGEQVHRGVIERADVSTPD